MTLVNLVLILFVNYKLRAGPFGTICPKCFSSLPFPGTIFLSIFTCQHLSIFLFSIFICQRLATLSECQFIQQYKLQMCDIWRNIFSCTDILNLKLSALLMSTQKIASLNLFCNHQLQYFQAFFEISWAPSHFLINQVWCSLDQPFWCFEKSTWDNIEKVSQNS